MKLAEAPSFGQSVLKYAPESNGAADYRALAHEYLRRTAPPAKAAPQAATPRIHRVTPRAARRPPQPPAPPPEEPRAAQSAG